jgi:hypothetical protein
MAAGLASPECVPGPFIRPAASQPPFHGASERTWFWARPGCKGEALLQPALRVQHRQQRLRIFRNACPCGILRVARAACGQHAAVGQRQQVENDIAAVYVDQLRDRGFARLQQGYIGVPSGAVGRARGHLAACDGNAVADPAHGMHFGPHGHRRDARANAHTSAVDLRHEQAVSQVRRHGVAEVRGVRLRQFRHVALHRDGNPAGGAYVQPYVGRVGEREKGIETAADDGADADLQARLHQGAPALGEALRRPGQAVGDHRVHAAAQGQHRVFAQRRKARGIARDVGQHGIAVADVERIVHEGIGGHGGIVEVLLAQQLARRIEAQQFLPRGRCARIESGSAIWLSVLNW